MPNPALTEKIRNLPPLLDSLERDAEVSDLLRRSYHLLVMPSTD